MSVHTRGWLGQLLGRAIVRSGGNSGTRSCSAGNGHRVVLEQPESACA
jgi:hypothetical protein